MRMLRAADEGRDTSARFESERRASQIRLLSRVMAALCTATSIALAAGVLIYWTITPTETILQDTRLPGIAVRDIGWTVRFAAIAISAVPLAFLIWGLTYARSCFDAFAAGRYFAIEAVCGLRMFAVSMLASTLLKPVAGAALSVLLSWSIEPGTKSMVVSVGSDTLLALLFAGMTAVIAWVMTEALVIRDENAQFV